MDHTQIAQALQDNNGLTIDIRHDDAGDLYFWALVHDEGTSGIGGMARSIAGCLLAAAPSVVTERAVQVSLSLSHYTTEDYDCVEVTPLSAPRYAHGVVTNCGQLSAERCRHLATQLMDRIKAVANE